MDAANNDLLSFMKYLKAAYHVDETDEHSSLEGAAHGQITQTDAHRIVRSLVKNYNFERIRENWPGNGNTSYTVNKGDYMYVCVRSATDPQKLVDKNTLLFVLLHECAHIGNYDGWGHTDRFWSVFKFILGEARRFGIYKYVNYESSPVMYCGLNVNYQPLDDAALAPIEGARDNAY
jgi:hypothetical protein